MTKTQKTQENAGAGLVQIIYDRQDTRNEGWYMRLSYTDAPSEDDRCDALDALSQDATDAQLIDTAMIYLMPVDGMTDRQMAEFRIMTQVSR
jgi:hypothetical protein